jgi:CheY-like chemotaxis protein
VLLVIADDDRDAAETLAELLRLLVAPPVEVVLAFDGQEALAYATGSTRPPDAVIMDIEMPRMGGVTAAIGIRRALGRGKPALIAVTGYAGAARSSEFGSAFDHVLAKPVNVDELIRLLRVDGT